MVSRLVGATGVSLLVVFAGAPVALADHVTPKKADKSTVSMVVAYQPCLAPTLDDPAIPGDLNACPGTLVP